MEKEIAGILYMTLYLISVFYLSLLIDKGNIIEEFQRGCKSIMHEYIQIASNATT